MGDWIQKEKCQFCGRQAKRFMFATLVCDSDECLEQARRERGGPGGHQAKKWALEKK